MMTKNGVFGSLKAPGLQAASIYLSISQRLKRLLLAAMLCMLSTALSAMTAFSLARERERNMILGHVDTIFVLEFEMRCLDFRLIRCSLLCSFSGLLFYVCDLTAAHHGFKRKCSVLLQINIAVTLFLFVFTHCRLFEKSSISCSHKLPFNVPEGCIVCDIKT